jgi:hypothetical protein
MIDKLEVKNSAMKSKQTREMAQLKSKEDVGGSLHKVDFDQLKIENTRYAEIMHERVRELLDLKVVVGGTNNNLNMLKVSPLHLAVSCILLITGTAVLILCLLLVALPEAAQAA